ncbi:uncharacterized protein gask1a isoform X2 [Halichoeres trimaculatus]|uniref:uncharacterized protein gask1a isoform X2 n=1 Tax=Halichoeres trimaculatus TaxID=147232 RepID=UPI003D9F4280
MAWRVWSKVYCGQKWLLCLSPLFLLFLTIAVMTMTLPLSLPITDIDRRTSRVLSSAGEFRSSLRMRALPPVEAVKPPLTHIHSQSWSLSGPEETSKPSAAPEHFRDAAGDDQNGVKDRRHADAHKSKHKSKDMGLRRKAGAGASQNPTGLQRHHIPEFTVNNTGLKPLLHTVQTRVHLKHSKSKAAPISAAVEASRSDGREADRLADRQADRQADRLADRQADRLADRLADRQADRLADRREERHANTNEDRQAHGRHTSAELSEHQQALKKHRQLSGKSDKVNKEQQAVKKPSGDLKKHHNLPVDPSEAKRSPGRLDRRKALSKPEAAMKLDDSRWCHSFEDFSDKDQTRIRISPGPWPLPWFSEDDVRKMELLARGQVVSKARVPAHGQVLQVALDPPAQQQSSQATSLPHHEPVHRHPESHSERCQRGLCSLIKRTDDWFEVFAFHLDRVLGLNRSLPAVLRTFHSEILPYRYIRGVPRPVVWWDPDIQHLSDGNNDQNSIPLGWVQYQKLLQAHCGRDTDLRTPPCVGVHHSEWGRLALFDFLLQVNDRLDRYCCGFTPDPSELCVENLLHDKCANTKDLQLVHILVRKADPSSLVFIDNAGRPEQSSDNLNFRLVEGVDEFPEPALSVLRSGCLETLLLHSLHTDREFWDSQGGASGLRPLIQTVVHRGKILLQHIRDRKLQQERDL